MDKILVSIYVLTIDDTFDLFIPINSKVSELLDIIQNSIVELSGGIYVPNKDCLLYSGVDGKVINKNNIVKFSGITNGSRLLLK